MKSFTSVLIATVLSQGATAWIPSPQHVATTPRTSTSSTALFMFDWMNPNKKKDADDKKEDSGDIFGNMFKIDTVPAKEDKEEAAHATPETPAAAATEVEVTPPTETKKEDDFVAESFNKVEEVKVEEEKPKEIVAEVKEEVKVAVDDEKPKETATAAATTEDRPRVIPDIDADGTTIHRGRVRWFYPKKGFGFISPVDEKGDFLYPKTNENRDVFVHQSDIYTGDVKLYRNLFNNERVEFKAIKDGNDRIKAVEVTGPDGTPPKCVLKKLKRDAEEQG